MSGIRKRLPLFGSENKLTLTSTLFRTRGGMSHTFNSISSRNDPKPIYCILPRQAHRSGVYAVKVHPHPPPPAKADSDQTIWHAMVRLGGCLAPNRHARTKNKIRLSTGRRLDPTEVANSCADPLQASFLTLAAQ